MPESEIAAEISRQLGDMVEGDFKTFQVPPDPYHHRKSIKRGEVQMTTANWLDKFFALLKQGGYKVISVINNLVRQDYWDISTPKVRDVTEILVVVSR